MPLIVLMEDEDGTRMLLTSLLKKQGYKVLSAENGAVGLDLVKQHRPDLVISDVQMPVMDGLEMLARMRQIPEVAGTPLILLTSLQERSSIRLGMNTGADDYITKPFLPREVYEAVAAQLNKRQTQSSLQSAASELALKAALQEQKSNLSRLYEMRLAQELGERWPEDTSSSEDVLLDSATVLFVDIAHYSVLAQQLTSDELSRVIKRFYGSAGDTVHLFGAYHIQFVGSGLIAVFANSENTASVNHGLRAVRAALGLIDSARAMGHYLQQTFANRSLPDFQVNVALNSGPVSMAVMKDPLHGGPAQTLPVGVAVNAVVRLKKFAVDRDWPVIASVSTLRTVTGAVRIGRRALLEAQEEEPALDAAELLGLETSA